MFGLTFTADVQARWKNGQPHQKTTGIASAICTQFSARTHSCGGWSASGSQWLMASAMRGTPNSTPTQKRRVMSINSGFGPSSAVTVRGSSAMPHFGQLPGRSLTTSGSIGQKYSTAAPAGASTAGGGAGVLSRYGRGLASNLRRQDGLQK